MYAFRLNEWKSEPVLVQVPDPDPGPGQVVVRVGGAGVCHSDLHLMNEFGDEQVAWRPPFTLGHENAGWVYAIGSGVSGLNIGDPVAVYGAWGCGACSRCRLGMENYCADIKSAPVAGGGAGLGLDGGIAEYLLVPNVRHLLPIPSELDMASAASLTDAGVTAYHAVRRSLTKLQPGTNAVVLGVGGLGHLGVQILRAMTAAQIIAVDTNPDALQLAREDGADVALPADESVVQAVRDATKGQGADVVIDFVGSDKTLSLAAALARQLGDVTITGIGGGTLPISFFSIRREVSVQTTYWGSRPELAEVLNLAAQGQIRPRITTFALEEAGRAYSMLAAGEIRGRAVIVPSR